MIDFVARKSDYVVPNGLFGACRNFLHDPANAKRLAELVGWHSNGILKKAGERGPGYLDRFREAARTKIAYDFDKNAPIK